MNTYQISAPDYTPNTSNTPESDAPLLDAYSHTVVNVAKKVSPSVVKIRVSGR